MPCGLRRACALAAIAAAHVGCESATGSNRDIVVRDSAGTQIVESFGAGWSEATAWKLSPIPLLSIGAVTSSDPAFEFSRINGLARLSDGRLAVLEGQLSEVRWFDADGNHLVTRGGRGGGPGEFRYALSINRIAGDTIVVEDRPQIAHVLFSPAGDFVREEALDLSRFTALGPWVECLSRTLPDRSLLACQPDPEHPRPDPSPGPGHHRSYARFVRVPLTLDTVIPLGLEAGIEQWGIEYGGRTRYAVHPFHAHAVVTAGGDPWQIAIAINPEYSIELWTPDGNLARIVRRPGARREPTEEERAEARSQMSIWAQGDEVLANRFAAEIAEPDTVPAVYDLLIDSTNHLWVLRSNFLPSETSFDADVFDDAGAFLGTLQLPEGFTPFEIGSDYILGVREDENDVPFIEMYRLQRSLEVGG